MKRFMCGLACVGMVAVGLLAACAGLEAAPTPADEQQAAAQVESALENIRRTNPERYQQVKARLDRQRQLSQISMAVQAGQMNVEEARKRLYPLVKAEVDEQRQEIDTHIAVYEKHLAELQMIKQNPDQVVEQRIRTLLGQASSAR